MIVTMERQFKEIASLIGDPTRATIMWTLLDGKAFTATELAIAADTTPQNISMHLSKLMQAELLRVESQGRHRYYKFSRKEIAYAIEAMASLLPHPDAKKETKIEKSLIAFAEYIADNSDRKPGTTKQLKQTIRLLKEFSQSTNYNLHLDGIPR